MEYCTPEQLINVLERYAIGYIPKDSPFFASGNACLPKLNKHGVVRSYEDCEASKKTNEDKSRTEATSSINCNIPGCGATFKSTKTYESHYNSLHRYGCSMCHKNLPSAHLLDLHIEESHDSFFAAKAERDPMVSCNAFKRVSVNHLLKLDFVTVRLLYRRM